MYHQFFGQMPIANVALDVTLEQQLDDGALCVWLVVGCCDYIRVYASVLGTPL